MQKSANVCKREQKYAKAAEVCKYVKKYAKAF